MGLLEVVETCFATKSDPATKKSRGLTSKSKSHRVTITTLMVIQMRISVPWQ